MAANDQAERVEIATRGGQRKAQNDAVRRERFAEHAAYIKSIVDAAPPLTEIQRARLAALLLGARRSDEVAIAG